MVLESRAEVVGGEVGVNGLFAEEAALADAVGLDEALSGEPRDILLRYAKLLGGFLREEDYLAFVRNVSEKNPRLISAKEN